VSKYDFRLYTENGALTCFGRDSYYMTREYGVSAKQSFSNCDDDDDDNNDTIKKKSNQVAQTQKKKARPTRKKKFKTRTVTREEFARAIHYIYIHT